MNQRSGSDFPSLEKQELEGIAAKLDAAYRELFQQYSDSINAWFEPLSTTLLAFERLLVDSPWFVVLIGISLFFMFISRSLKWTAGTALLLSLLGVFGLWHNVMLMLATVLFSSLITVIIGIPLGIVMGFSNRFQSVLNPLLTLLLITPAIVFLIPAVLLGEAGRIPMLIAVILYTLPLIIRQTSIGLRGIDPEILGTAEAFGASRMERFRQIEMPLAKPSIISGLHQAVLMALGLATIAALVGLNGLGQPVIESITEANFSLGLMNGVALIILAVILDRVSQAWLVRSQPYLKQTDLKNRLI